MSDWLKEIQKQQEASKATLLALIPQLKAAGIAYVVAYYDGSGDSGQIEEVHFFDATADQDEVYGARSIGDISGNSKPAPLLTDAIDLDPIFDNLCPPGYENNDGGFGAVILDVEGAKIRVNSAARFTDYDTDDYEV